MDVCKHTSSHDNNKTEKLMKVAKKGHIAIFMNEINLNKINEQNYITNEFKLKEQRLGISITCVCLPSLTCCLRYLEQSLSCYKTFLQPKPTMSTINILDRFSHLQNQFINCFCQVPCVVCVNVRYYQDRSYQIKSLL